MSEITKVINPNNNNLNKSKLKNKLTFKKFIKREFSKKRIKEYLILVLAAIICTFSYDYFISATTQYGVFPSGAGALARMFAIYSANDKSINNQNAFYFVYLFIMNFPLFIFGGIKISWRFSLKTVVFIFLQSVVNIIFENLPYVNPQSFHLLVDYANYSGKDTNDAGYQIWLFIFAILGGLTFGYSCALTYSVNGSSGGTDFASMYFSVKSKRSIGNINKYINIIILIIVIIMNTFHTSLNEFRHIYNNDSSNTLKIQEYRIKYLFGPSLFASLLFVLVQSAVINVSYPKYQYRTLFIITKKSDIVIHSMRKVGTVLNDISVWDAINTQFDEKIDTKGYKIIMSTITLLEYKKVKHSVMKSDPEARVFLQKVDRIAGSFTIRNNFS